MDYAIELQRLPAQQMATVSGRATRPQLHRAIQDLFDEFRASFKGTPGRSIVYYSTFASDAEFEIECGMQVERGGNSLTPGGSVARATHLGPHADKSRAHDAIQQWSRESGRRLAGPSWEVYDQSSDDPAKQRVEIFYLVAAV